MQKDERLDKIREIVSNIFNDNGIELVKITLNREGGKKVLRILADTERGITMEECAKMNEVVGEALDSGDIINENYILEISSPGLDRLLKTKEDFMRARGKRIQVYAFAPIEGKREFAGLLDNIDDNGIIIFAGGKEPVQIPFEKISKATLDYKEIAEKV